MPKSKRNARPKMLVAAPWGEVFEHPTFELAVDDGAQFLRAAPRDLIPLPDGWDMMAMPGTRPVGYDPESGQFITLDTFTVEVDGTEKTFEPAAVAAHPPPGYVRQYHPAAEYLDTSHPDEKVGDGGLLSVIQPQQDTKSGGGDDAARPGLPLWAYTAVGYGKSGPGAALFLADETTRWAPELYYKDDLETRVQARLDAEPDNLILKQLASCATEYLCCCAQNVFYERWEGAVPTAPGCTAACLGCISKDPEWNTPTPQKRLKFKPDPAQIASVMAHHLERADEPMVSFGQGCEGEPTMNGDVLVESVRLTRARTPRGIININTNGSRPDVIRRAAEAGASALRVSINTFHREVYTAYYRPADYTIDDVVRSLYIGRDAGMYNSVNLLIWPGWTDRLAEVDALSKIVEDGALQMIQLRNLCVDPGYFRSVLPPKEERGLLLGMRGFVEELHRRHPQLRFGTFNPRLAADWYDDVAPLIDARSARPHAGRVRTP